MLQEIRLTELQIPRFSLDNVEHCKKVVVSTILFNLNQIISNILQL